MNLEQNCIDLYSRITNLLIEKKLQISTMESCTSGLAASFLTDTEGASAVLKGAFITYSNEAKIRCGVPADIIETYGVYSRETAEAMAKACRDAYGADIGLAFTGSLGTADPANPDSVPGEVWFALDFCGTIHSHLISDIQEPDRHSGKLAALHAAAQHLLPLLTCGEPSPAANRRRRAAGGETHL